MSATARGCPFPSWLVEGADSHGVIRMELVRLWRGADPDRCFLYGVTRYRTKAVAECQLGRFCGGYGGVILIDVWGRDEVSGADA
jgi:hypothetical protein